MPRALESGQLSGHCGLRIGLNGERPVAIDPSQTSPRPQALTEPLLPNKVSWIVARFGGAEGRRSPAKAAFNPARRLSEQLLRYPLNGVGAELREAVAERQEVFEGR